MPRRCLADTSVDGRGAGARRRRLGSVLSHVGLIVSLGGGFLAWMLLAAESLFTPGESWRSQRVRKPPSSAVIF